MLEPLDAKAAKKMAKPSVAKCRYPYKIAEELGVLRVSLDDVLMLIRACNLVLMNGSCCWLSHACAQAVIKLWRYYQSLVRRRKERSLGR